MKRSTLLSTLAAALHAATPPARHLPPVDESAKDASFAAFKARLLAALEKKDASFLLTVVAEDVQVSGGDDLGIKAFRNFWKLDTAPAQSGVWAELAAVLKLGCAYDPQGTFSAPYLYARFPNGLDTAEYVVAVHERAPLRAAGNASAPVIETLHYDVLQVLDTGQDPGVKDRWPHVRSASGKAGYVDPRDVRSPLGYRAGFERRKGAWLLTYFLSGD